MLKTLLELSHLKYFAKLLPTLLGIDEYDDRLKEQNEINSNKKEDLISIIIITIVCFILYISLNSSLTIDEFL